MQNQSNLPITYDTQLNTTLFVKVLLLMNCNNKIACVAAGIIEFVCKLPKQNSPEIVSLFNINEN